MGTILSREPEIDDIHWVRLSGRPMKAKAAVIVPNGTRNDLMVVALENGAYASSWDLSKGAYMPGEWPWNAAVMAALVKLGAISPAAAKRHLAHCKAVSARSSRKYAAQNLAEIAEKHGLDLSDAQRAFIAEATQ